MRRETALRVVASLIVVIGADTKSLSSGTFNVAGNKPVTLAGGPFFNGHGATASPSTIVDGVFFPAGTQWDQGSVWWDAHSSSGQYITIDLGSACLITSLIVQADDNDAYRVYYWDIAASTWKIAWDVPNSDGAIETGMVTRPNAADDTERYVLPAPVVTNALRVEGVVSESDKWFSVSEVQAFSELTSPTASTQAATDITPGEATLNGTVTNDGGGACQCRFRYRKAGGLYTYTECTGSRRTGQSFSLGIGGLDASTTYYFAAQARNSVGESTWPASDQSFTTSAPAIWKPKVTTQPATNVNPTGPTLNGTVASDGGEACQYRFRYKPFGGTYSYTPYAGAVRTGQSFSQQVTGLTAGATYYFNTQIKNSAGESDWGSEQTLLDGTVFHMESVPVCTFRATLLERWTNPYAGSGTLDVFAPVPPQLATQTSLSAHLSVAEDPTLQATGIAELSGLSRSMLRLSIGSDKVSPKSGVTLKAEYTGTLYTSQLKSGSPPHMLPPTSDSGSYLGTSATMDYDDPGFSQWLDQKGLHRQQGERTMQFAHRVYTYLIANATSGGDTSSYEARRPSQVCKSMSSDCGGLSLLFVAVMRANGVGARTLFGRWAITQSDSYGQYHVIAEFYADNVGWVPVDVGRAVANHPEDPYAFFGNTDGQFLAFHVDTDLQPAAGFQHAWAQYLLLRWTGDGDFWRDFNLDSQWTVQLGPASGFVVGVPSAATQSAGNLRAISATLNGIVANDGGEACQYRFRYKPAGGNYTYTAWTGAVSTSQSFSEAVTGLAAETTYYFSAAIKNSAGESTWANELSLTTPSLPDLRILQFSHPTVIRSYDKFTVTCRVINGGGSETGPFTVGVYASGNRDITPFLDTMIGNIEVSTIRSGDTIFLEKTWDFPQTANGAYYVGFIADAYNEVLERNESNNSMPGGPLMVDNQDSPGTLFVKIEVDKDEYDLNETILWTVYAWMQPGGDRYGLAELDWTPTWLANPFSRIVDGQREFVDQASYSGLSSINAAYFSSENGFVAKGTAGVDQNRVILNRGNDGQPHIVCQGNYPAGPWSFALNQVHAEAYDLAGLRSPVSSIITSPATFRVRGQSPCRSIWRVKTDKPVYMLGEKVRWTLYVLNEGKNKGIAGASARIRGRDFHDYDWADYRVYCDNPNAPWTLIVDGNQVLVDEAYFQGKSTTNATYFNPATGYQATVSYADELGNAVVQMPAGRIVDPNMTITRYSCACDCGNSLWARVFCSCDCPTYLTSNEAKATYYEWQWVLFGRSPEFTITQPPGHPTFDRANDAQSHMVCQGEYTVDKAGWHSISIWPKKTEYYIDESGKTGLAENKADQVDFLVTAGVQPNPVLHLHVKTDKQVYAHREPIHWTLYASIDPGTTRGLEYLTFRMRYEYAQKDKWRATSGPDYCTWWEGVYTRIYNGHLSFITEEAYSGVGPKHETYFTPESGFEVEAKGQAFGERDTIRQFRPIPDIGNSGQEYVVCEGVAQAHANGGYYYLYPSDIGARYYAIDPNGARGPVKWFDNQANEVSLNIEPFSLTFDWYTGPIRRIGSFKNIDRAVMITVLKDSVTEEMNAEISQKGDSNGDGQISISEFLSYVVPAPLLRADVTQDQNVDGKDFAVLGNAYGTAGCFEGNGFCGGADLDRNGRVDMIDLVYQSQMWLSDIPKWMALTEPVIVNPIYLDAPDVLSDGQTLTLTQALTPDVYYVSADFTVFDPTAAVGIYLVGSDGGNRLWLGRIPGSPGPTLGIGAGPTSAGAQVRPTMPVPYSCRLTAEIDRTGQRVKLWLGNPAEIAYDKPDYEGPLPSSGRVSLPFYDEITAISCLVADANGQVRNVLISSGFDSQRTRQISRNSLAGTTLLTFEGITTNDSAKIPSTYNGLSWSSRFYVGNGTKWTNCGYEKGMVSSSYVAYNDGGQTVEIGGSPFDLIGAYMAGAWNDNLNIEILAYRSNKQVYTETAIVSSTKPTWVQLDYANIDRVTFRSYGGVHNPAYSLSGVQMVMDNMVIRQPPASAGPSGR